MTVYCFGKFTIPHAGHSKLFQACNTVLSANTISPFHRIRLASYAERHVIDLRNGCIVEWLQLYGDKGDTVVLDSYGYEIGNKLLAAGYAVKYIETTPGMPSVSAMRKEFIEANVGTADPDEYVCLDMVAKGWHLTETKARIAYELWIRGY